MKRHLVHSLQFTRALGVSAMAIAICSCAQPRKAGVSPASENPVAGLPSRAEAKGPAFPQPDHERGIYLTAWSASSKRKLDKIFPLCDANGINSVVIDVRDAGDMYWDTGIPLAADSHANKHAIRDFKPLMASLAAHKLYPIARIACFCDNYVPRAFPALGVQFPNGTTWQDRARHSWLDPYNKKNWEYIAKVVDFALDAGFPEIQLDYIRFPSEGKKSSEIFPAKKSYPDGKAKQEDVIAAFADYIAKRVHARSALCSADVFGMISEKQTDIGIGQQLEKLAKPFDMVCPMVYPSHWTKGEYGIKDPNKAPYEIVSKSLKDYVRRLPGKRIRPWLQAFSLYHVHYGDKEILDQIRAAKECGYEDFLLWNAANRYDFGPSFGKDLLAIAAGPSTSHGAAPGGPGAK